MTVRGAIVDVDGTLVRGEQVVPGARAGVEALREAGCAVLFVSNNPITHHEAYRERLLELGFSVAPGEMVTSGTVTAEVLAADHPHDPVFVVGEPGLERQLESMGLALTDEPTDARVLVASIDRSFSYDTLVRAMQALRDGAVFVGTDPDMTIPTEDGEVPGSGAIIHAIEGVAGRTVDRVMGKPSMSTIDVIRDRLGVPLEATLVIGDRLDTDIAMGSRVGMTTVLVKTGVTTDSALAASTVEPDHVIDSIEEIGAILDDG